MSKFNTASGLSLLGLSLVLAAAPISAHADTIVVGSGAGCTHSSLASAFLAAAISAGGDTIIIAENLTHSGAVAFNLTSEAAVTIRGGVNCSNTAAQRHDITMTQGDLFEFVDTNVTLRDLRLISDTNGGRPVTASNNSVIILESNIFLQNGKASSGGNVHLSGGASLVMLDGAVVMGGLADFDGGGIYCTGAGSVGVGTGSLVRENRADFNGGGVYATSGCTVNVFAGGPSVFGAGIFEGIFNNDAGFNGGGLYGASGATVLVAGSANETASIRSNTAESRGGGLYLTGSGTTAEILSAEIVDNSGWVTGGGFYVASNATLLMERDLASCDRGIRCSLLEGNFTVSLSGIDTEGGTIAVAGGGSAQIRQTYITGSSSAQSGKVALVDGAGSFLLLEGDVLFNNSSTGPHVLARNGGHARVAYSSIWGSSTSGFAMVLLQAGDNSRVDLYSSLVIEGNGVSPGGGPDRVFGTPGSAGVHIADCVISHETASFPSSDPGSVIIETDPAVIWVLPATGDPHLRAGSPAIDFCDDFIYAPVDDDIDGESRAFDDTTVADNFGPFDLGADEGTAAVDSTIFADGFESGDTTAWSSTTP